MVRGVGLCACSLRSHCRTQTATAYHATEGGVKSKKEISKLKYIIILSHLVVVSGCATSNSVKYLVTSEPENAQIDVNGVEMGATPTEVNLECAKKWVGVINAPGGWANASGPYSVKAYPPRGSGGEIQTKNVDPCQWSGEGNPSIKFDLEFESVAPTQKIEVVKTNPESNLEATINSLKLLRDQGVLSEEE